MLLPQDYSREEEFVDVVGDELESRRERSQRVMFLVLSHLILCSYIINQLVLLCYCVRDI